MNRIFKFRVWHNTLNVFLAPGEWVIDLDGKLRFIDFGCLNGGEDSVVYPPADEKLYVIQQSTGLKDKNGREIYEGDVLEGQDTQTFYDKLFVRYEPDYGGYSFNYPFDSHNVWQHWFKQLSNLEIIGNILENPDLAKV